MRIALLPLLAAVLVWTTSLTAEAAPRFNGFNDYEFVGNMASVAINVGMIDNSAGKGGTGSLLVKLYATKTLYSGGSISGAVVGSFKLDPLKAGQVYRDLHKVVPYEPPTVKGTYYMTLALLEFQVNGYAVVDYRNLKNTATLAPLKTFTIEGPWLWQTNTAAGTMDLGIGKISHRRTAATGTLKLSQWATVAPYHGGELNGYEIGSITKDKLESGYSYTGLKQMLKFTPPPDGTYFVTLMLSEFQNGAYRMVDYLKNAEAYTFKKPVP